MKTLILYCSDYGFAEKCGQMIGERTEDAVCINFKSEDMKALDLNTFDIIIIGASIHAGKISKKFKEYLISNESTLLKKKIAIYLCCMDNDKAEEYLKAEIPEKIYDHAFFKGHIGYALTFEKMNLIIRAMIKNISHQDKNVEEIKYDIIDSLTEKLKEYSS